MRQILARLEVPICVNPIPSAIAHKLATEKSCGGEGSLK